MVVSVVAWCVNTKIVALLSIVVLLSRGNNFQIVDLASSIEMSDELAKVWACVSLMC